MRVTEEELQATLWQIVRAVASERSTYVDERFWDVTFVCPFCDGSNDKEQEDHVMHEDTCIVAEARKLVEKGILA